MQYDIFVLGSLVLVGCIAAIGGVVGILFVLYGPVPIKRKVTMVSRIQAPMPLAAMPVMFQPPPPPVTPVEAPVQPAATAVEPPAATAVEPPAPKKVVAPPRKKSGYRPPARRAPSPAPSPPRAPIVTAPRGDSPPPLPRARAARGTHGRPTDFDNVEMTARDAGVFDAITRDARAFRTADIRTVPHQKAFQVETSTRELTTRESRAFQVETTAADTPMFDADEPTFLEDGH